jgi:hypothetical protein
VPTRYLKPGICDSEKIDRIQSPIAENLYYRLLTNVDDFGRMDARPSVVRSKCFPLRENLTSDTVLTWMHDLAQAGLIILYVVDGKPYLQFTGWDNKPRADESKCPPVPAYADKCMQIPTVLPVTVTGTKTETATDIAPSDKSLNADKPAKSIDKGAINGDAVIYIPLVGNAEWGVSKAFARPCGRYAAGTLPILRNERPRKVLRGTSINGVQRSRTVARKVFDNPADLHANAHIQCAYEGCNTSAMEKHRTKTGWAKLCHFHADRMHMDEAHANLDKYGLAKEPDETTKEHTARMREFFRNSFRNFKTNLTRKAA